jgi:hypothetical protein
MNPEMPNKRINYARFACPSGKSEALCQRVMRGVMLLNAF